MSPNINNTAITIDANVLVAWCSDKTPSDVKSRLDFLLLNAERDQRRIIIPTPAMAEFLVRTDEATTAAFNILERKAAIYVAPFDRRAAFECALLDAAAVNRGDKRDGSQEPYQKIKIDRQIVAIAKVYSSGLIVAQDEGVRKIAGRAGIEAKTINDLDLPPSPPQQTLDLQQS